MKTLGIVWDRRDLEKSETYSARRSQGVDMEDEEGKKARKEGSETCLSFLRDEGENARAG